MIARALLWMAVWISLASGYPQGSVRLVRSWTEDSGYLEVLSDGDWSVVSDENWTEEDGNVACKELGYEALATIPAPTSLCPVQSETLVIDSVNCSGAEQKISQCAISPASASKSKVAPSGVSCTDGLGLRLVNSSDDLSKGWLEVYYQGQWRSVCADGFTPADSSTACHQLGFSEGEWDATDIGSGISSPDESDLSYVNFNSSCSEGQPIASLRSCSGDVVVSSSCLATVQLQCFGLPYPLCPPELEEVSCTDIQFSWQPPPLCTADHASSSCNITNYALRYRLVETSVNTSSSSHSSLEWQRVETPSASTLQQDITGLEPGSLYEVQLQAANAYGNGTVSKSLWVKTLPPMLPVPGEVVVSATSAGSASISWKVDVDCSAVTVIGFRVSYTTDNSSLQQQLITDGSARQASVLDLQPSSMYWFSVQVLGCLSEDECVMSTARQGLASGKVAIETPFPDFSFSTVLTTSESDFCLTAINASWQLDCDSSVLSHLLGYTVECRDNSSSSSSSSGSVLRDSLASVESGSLLLPVQGSALYTCTVTALLAGGIELSGLSEEIGTPPTVPLSPPMSLNATNIGVDWFQLRWQFTGMGPQGSFRIQVTGGGRTTEETLHGLIPVSEDGPEYTYMVTGLCPGRTYLVSVAATNSAGQGSSASTLVTTTERVPAHSPTDFTYQSSSVVGDFIMISLSWSYATPVANNATGCKENVIGYSVECKDINSMVKLSQVTLAVSGSQQQQQQHFTEEVAISQDLGAVLLGINCTVAAFNAAGMGDKTEKLPIDLSGFFVSLGVLENAAFNNPYLSLAYLIIAGALLMLLLVIAAMILCYYCTIKLPYLRRKSGKYTVARPSSGEVAEDSYITMGTAPSIIYRNQEGMRDNEHSSLWIDAQPPHSTILETFLPDHDDKLQCSAEPGLVFSQKDVETSMDAAALDKASEDDTYDEVGAEPPTQQIQMAAAENVEEGRTSAEVAVTGPKTVGPSQERENVYDEIVSVTRITEANSLEELDMMADLPTGAHLPPPEGGTSLSLSQDTLSLTPSVPPPNEFSALPSRRSTVAGVGHSRERRPAPLPPATSARRMTTAGKGMFHRGRGRDTASTNSLRRKLIVISSGSTEETDEAAYCKVASPEKPTGGALEVPHENSEQNNGTPSTPSSPQYEIMVHPKSFSFKSDVSARMPLPQDTASASHKSDDGSASCTQEKTCSDKTGQT